MSSNRRAPDAAPDERRPAPPAGPGPGAAPANASLVRGLRILDCVAELGRARVDDLAARVDLPLSTVYRYVRQLRDMGYLYEVDGHYTLGVDFSERRRDTGHLVRLAEPVLRGLRDSTGEAVVLTVRVRTAALCLDRLMPQRRYLLSFQRGTVRPLYAGASVLPLLAFATPDVVDDVLAGPMRRITARTPDREALKREVAQVREHGFAVSRGEVDPGMVAVGVPVFRGRGCICAVSVVGSEHSMAEDRLENAVRAAREAGAALGARLNSADGAVAWTAGEEW
ncbi:IclR family transcriptional regulator [Murinocardiopsis flavida]|uniref:IclR family transcriptional regulator n=1 Tax=Murinocardiopsis flavida TaxID=645275 RepID=A0A2P8DQA4_9ACTN|nr:IclR family transcriptional regulator [Murinocardiopsis flavida]PSK99403.1 IclR family transcriptional regulator [Murinocardiopsis flavida]